MKPLAATLEASPRAAALCFVVSLVLALLVGLAGLQQQSLVRALDRAVLDTLQRQTASGAQAMDTVVVDIDEVSLSAVGQWPWPRYRLAALIQGIQAQRPAAIAMDILLPEADRASLSDIQRTFKRDFDLDVSFAGVPEGLLDNDGYLGEQMARADVVGARYFYFDHATRQDQPVRPGRARQRPGHRLADPHLRLRQHPAR